MTQEELVLKYAELKKENEKLKEGITNAKTEIEDSGAFEQEVNGKTEYLRGINYCLGVLNKNLGE